MLGQVLTRRAAPEESLPNELLYGTRRLPITIDPPPPGAPRAEAPEVRGSRRNIRVTPKGGRSARPKRMALEPFLEGENLPGKVFLFVRDNTRVPVRAFLEELTGADQRKFQGNFRTLVQVGKTYRNRERFKPLRDEGKPLWEFKEHDHRIYCVRREVGDCVYAVLLFGWTKDKAGRHREETRSIERAQSYRWQAEEELNTWLRQRRQNSRSGIC